MTLMAQQEIEDTTTTQRRKVKLRRLVNDFWSGMSNAELIQKYRIQPNQLQRLFDELIGTGLLRFSQIYEKSLTPRPPRTYVHVRFPVYDARDRSFRGLIRDISEKGMRIASFRNGLEKATAFMIAEDSWFEVRSFQFEAVCRWSKLKGHQKKYHVGGFEITRISDEARGELRKLVKALQFDTSERNGSGACPQGERLELEIS